MAFYTNTFCGSENKINFKRVTRTLKPGCNDYRTISGLNDCSLSPPLYATLQSGFANALSPKWGFITNAASPFTMNMYQIIDWLYDDSTGGTRDGFNISMLEKLQEFTNFNTQSFGGINSLEIFPALGSPRQMSGNFPFNMKTTKLTGLCTSGLRVRLLNPYESVLKLICNSYVQQGIINNVTLTFIPAVGGVSVLALVQNTSLNPPVGGSSVPVGGYEFAAAGDNYNALTGGFFPDIKSDNLLASPTCSGNNAVPFPLCLQNPGHKGLTYWHDLNWHQPQLIAWMMINQTLFDSLSKCQKDAIKLAGKHATVESYERSSKYHCEFTDKILDFNDDQLQLNPDGTPKDCNPDIPGLQTCSADIVLGTWKQDDLDILNQTTVSYLNNLAATDAQANFIINSLNSYGAKIGFKWENIDYWDVCKKNKPCNHNKPLQAINEELGSDSISNLSKGFIITSSIVGCVGLLAIVGFLVHKYKLSKASEYERLQEQTTF